MSNPTLHCIHDPLCGWCYGAAPLVSVARETLHVQAHGGGMMAGAARRAVTPDLRQIVMLHDQRIAQFTGQAFGPGYFDGLLCDADAVLDSVPPIAATQRHIDQSRALLARVGGHGFPTFALKHDGRFTNIDISP